MGGRVMNKSKKQIWVVWHIDEWGKYIFPALITTSITKVKSFLLNKIKLGEEVYNSTVYSKSKMIEQIENTGDFDINSIPVRTKDKQALETIRVMLIGAGLRVSYGNDKLSYVLPKE